MGAGGREAPSATSNLLIFDYKTAQEVSTMRVIPYVIAGFVLAEVLDLITNHLKKRRAV